MPGLLQALLDLRTSGFAANTNNVNRIIFFESHIGKSTRLLSSIIDYVIWIDCDYDIALARALLSSLHQGASIDFEYYLSTYLKYSSDLLRLQRQRIRSCASYMYDGDLARLVTWINESQFRRS
jgi:hypothetical protein